MSRTSFARSTTATSAVGARPGELLDAPHRRGAVFGRLLDLPQRFEQAPGSISPRSTSRSGQLGPPEHGRQQVVDVVGDAGRELTERPQLFGLRCALLGVAAIRHVAQHDQRAVLRHGQPADEVTPSRRELAVNLALEFPLADADQHRAHRRLHARWRR